MLDGLLELLGLFGSPYWACTTLHWVTIVTRTRRAGAWTMVNERRDEIMSVVVEFRFESRRASTNSAVAQPLLNF